MSPQSILACSVVPSSHSIICRIVASSIECFLNIASCFLLLAFTFIELNLHFDNQTVAYLRIYISFR